MRESLDPNAASAVRALLKLDPSLSDSLTVEAARQKLNGRDGTEHTYDDMVGLLNANYKGAPAAPVAPPASLHYPADVGTAASDPLDTGVAAWFMSDSAGQQRQQHQLLEQLKVDYGEDAVAQAMLARFGRSRDAFKAGQMDFGAYWRRANAVQGLRMDQSGLYDKVRAMGWDYDSPEVNPKALAGIPAWNVAPEIGMALKAMTGQGAEAAMRRDLPDPVVDAAKFAGKLGHATLRNSVDRVFLAGNAAMANGGLQAMADLIQMPQSKSDESGEFVKHLARAGKAFAHAVIMSPDDVAAQYASPEAVFKMASDEDEGVRALADWQWGQDLPSPARDAVEALTTSFGLDQASAFHPAKAAIKVGMSLVDPFFIAAKGLSAARAVGRSAGYSDAMARLVRRGAESSSMVDGFNRGIEAFPHIGEAFKEAADMPDLALLDQHADILQGIAGQVPEILNLPAYYDADGLAKAIANAPSMGGKGKARLALESEQALKLDAAGQVGLMEKRAQIAKMLAPEVKGAIAAMKRVGAEWQGKGPPMASYLDDMMTKTNGYLSKLGYDEAQIDDFWRQTDRYWQVRQEAGRAAKMGAVETVAKDLP